MPATTRTLACLLFDWQAETSLRAMLSVLRGRTQDAWEYSDSLTADMVIYPPDNTLAQALMRRAQGSARKQVFVPIAQTDQHELSLRYPFGVGTQRLWCLAS